MNFNELFSLLIIPPGVLVILLAISTVLTARWHSTVKYKITTGLISGIIAGIAMVLFIFLFAAPFLSHPWSNFVKILSLLMQGKDAFIIFSMANLVLFIKSISILLFLSGIMGAIYTVMLATKKMGRIIVGGIFFGLTAWAFFQYIIFPNFYLPVVEKGVSPLWLASAFAIYGLVLGELIAYDHRWKHVLDP